MKKSILRMATRQYYSGNKYWMEIEHSITIIPEGEFSREELSLWFRTMQENAPAGVMTTFARGEQSISIVRSGNQYIVPLLRDLTENEVPRIIEAFARVHDGDFAIQATSPQTFTPNPNVEIEHDPLIALCTEWAKRKHQEWKTMREGEGWRYGPVMMKANKTHPLLRDWCDIPDEYKKIDTTPVQEMLDLLKSSGYLLVHRDDLDNLL